jgi:phage gpG-like protein
MIKIEITDSGVMDSFNRLIAMGEDMSGPLAAIGEVLLTLTKQRFQQSTDPYGEPWKENSDTTLRALLHGSGKNFKKKGGLSKRGESVLAGKKPLIGASKSLSTQFAPSVSGGNTVTLTSLMPYAAMQNFGGTKAEFPHLWGDIPARAFFPDKARGLPDDYNKEISAVLRAALQNATKR